MAVVGVGGVGSVEETADAVDDLGLFLLMLGVVVVGGGAVAAVVEVVGGGDDLVNQFLESRQSDKPGGEAVMDNAVAENHQ